MRGRAPVAAAAGAGPALWLRIHISDRHAPIHGSTISAAGSKAAHAVDGPLHHGAAVALRNIARAIEETRAGGEAVPDAMLPFPSPLGRQPVNLTGDGSGRGHHRRPTPGTGDLRVPGICGHWGSDS